MYTDGGGVMTRVGHVQDLRVGHVQDLWGLQPSVYVCEWGRGEAAGGKLADPTMP